MTNSDVPSASPWVAVPAILLAIGISVAIAFAANNAFDVGAMIFFGTVIVCLPWLLIASNRQSNIEDCDARPPPIPAPLPARKYHKIMEEAQARQGERAAADSLLREEERITQLLVRARCFYRNGEEQVGPVSFFRVRELIEMDLLTPDVQVIAEGSDYWRTYAEWEFIVVPPRDHPTFSKLSKAAHLSCFYLDQGREVGPISLLAIFHYIRSGKLSPQVKIRTDGSRDWVSAAQI
ncbi:MAG: domain 2 [Verrucomicrobiota bacterium]